MIRSIYFAEGLARQAGLLRKSGRKGELAAGQYARLVELLRCSGPENEEVFSQRTKRGEYRIKNCVKYDLGSGYRLITIRLGDRLYVPFLGDHDDADLWLERHKQDGFQPRDSSYQCHCCERICLNSPKDESNEPSPEGDDLYERELQKRLDESTLKTVFSGLFRKEDEALAAGDQTLVPASASPAAKAGAAPLCRV